MKQRFLNWYWTLVKRIWPENQYVVIPEMKRFARGQSNIEVIFRCTGWDRFKIALSGAFNVKFSFKANVPVSQVYAKSSVTIYPPFVVTDKKQKLR